MTPMHRVKRKQRKRRFQRRSLFEQLERRDLLTADWRNPVDALDATGDRFIATDDALAGINELLANGSRTLPLPRPAGAPFVDTTGDGISAPDDVLGIINQLLRSPSPIYTLTEGGQINSQQSVVIGLGQNEGSRLYRFEIDAQFDASDTGAAIEDVLAVYLTGENDPSQTLLDRGENGTTIFALAGAGADFIPGLVRFDGSVVEIDLTSLGGLESGELLFQLLNSDTDFGSRVEIRPLSNELEEESPETPLLLAQKNVAAAGGPLDFAALTQTFDIVPIVNNIRYDSDSGEYRADVRLKNNGAPAGRDVALVLTGLPAGVSLRDASGDSPGGDPYLNFREAIPFGGLDRGALSDVLEVVIDTPAGARFSWSTEVLAGPANRAPLFDPIAPISVHPGERLEVQLSATDPDGDPVAFSLTPAAQMPTTSLTAGNRLIIAPRPDEVGQYSFVVHAGDGLLTSSQTVEVTVAPDPIGTTRISGQVLDTDGAAIPGAPISLSRITTLTDADGNFTLELPSTLLPSDRFDIPVPQGDPSFDPFNTGTETIEFQRARFDTLTGDSAQNPRRHPNLVTSFLDGGMVYGSDDERAAALRTLDGTGKLKTSAGDLLPLNNTTFFPSGPLENDSAGPVDPTMLFVAGDVRSSETPMLASLHTIFLREHNRLADEIATNDPGLSGEEIYQQARRLVAAQIQHITYNEYLPLLLGAGALPAYAGYDAGATPDIGALFTTAAFRIGHSQSPEEFQLLDDLGDPTSDSPLSAREAFFNSGVVIDNGIEPFLRGLAVQQTQEIDPHIVDALRNSLFGPPGSGGIDLGALSIQRGRDLGLPGYNQARVDLGLAPAASFADITTDAQLQAALAQTYDSVDDVDAFVGGLAEDHAPGAIVGELFQKVIVDQFERLRDADRFWFENEQLTSDELAFVRATTLAGLIERNTTITGLSGSVFTTGVAPSGPAAAGAAAGQIPSEVRSLDGSGNNLADPDLGSTGQHLLIDASLNYADGISAPTGANRPSARAVSNGVMAQSGSQPNGAGLTTMHMLWGQLVAHDISLTPTGVSETLKIHGDDANVPGVSYPFVAEKLGLMLNHEVYENVNNVIGRPIFLPALDVAGGTTINPAANTMVMQEIAPGEMAQVFVAAGTLKNQDGSAFDGVLSITEVPRDFTPAALPSNLFPDTVVTIQPGEMVFTQPAPLTFPNRAGWAPGTLMDLWSINPETGEFEDVGDMQVSGDGSVIETISGGVRNSSWHTADPQPDELEDENPRDCGCPRKSTAPAGSDAELGTGAYLETHQLATYQSLGVTRGVTLSYDSLRANPVTSARFSFNVAANTTTGMNAASADSLRLAAAVTVTTPSGAQFDATNGPATFGGALFGQLWTFGDLTVGNRLGGAVPIDLTAQPSGIYRYSLTSGVLMNSDDGLTGTMESVENSIMSVNEIDSPFGAGWGIAGWQEIVEHEQFQDVVMLIDGDGGELMYIVPFGPGLPYQSPPGDFSKLEKINDKFRRTMPDGTVYQFNEDNKLESVTDRNGNQTLYQYNAEGEIESIADPAGLVQSFNYENGMVAEIVDPAGRTTMLHHDADGNLTEITNPDSSQRLFGYNSRHLMMSDTDERGNLETVAYTRGGQFQSSTFADGSTISLQAAVTQGLAAGGISQDMENLPAADNDFTNEAMLVDANGNVTSFELNQSFLLLGAVDSIGRHFRLTRDMENQITEFVDGRGNEFRYSYDQSGNQVSASDVFTQPVVPGGIERVLVGLGVSDYATADLTGDGILEIVVVAAENQELRVLKGDQDGAYTTHQVLPTGDFPTQMLLVHLDADGRLDAVVRNQFDDSISVYSGNSDGTFAAKQDYAIGQFPADVQAVDLNNDGLPELVSRDLFSGTVSVLKNLGGGLFAAAASQNVGAQPVDMQFAHLNADTFLDAIIANEGSNNVSILLGDGAGGFNPQLLLAVGVSPAAFETAHLNADAHLDIVVTNSASGDVSVLLGAGGGAFLAQSRYNVGGAPTDVTIVDVDGDSFLDVLAGNSLSGDVSVLLGDGTGQFADEVRSGRGDSLALYTVADVTGDGLVDLIDTIDPDPADFPGRKRLGVFRGLGDGAFTPELEFDLDFGFQLQGLPLFEDVNDDGLKDIIVKSEAQVAVLFATASGGFNEAISYPVGHGLAFDGNVAPKISLPSFVDANGDGITDLISASDEDISIRFGDGRGGFARPLTTSAGGDLPDEFTAADVNGDGFIDFVVLGDSDNSLNVLLGSGDGSFALNKQYEFESALIGLVVDDVDGDGRLDLLTLEGGFAPLNTVLVHVAIQGAAGFPEETTISGAGQIIPEEFEFADVDNDGVGDVVLSGTFFANGPYVMLGNGDGTFQSSVSVFANDSTHVLLHHLDDDGAIDIVAPSFGGIGGIQLAFGNGDGTFTNPALLTLPAGVDPESVGVGDFDNDGNADIVVANLFEQKLAIMFGDGLRNFSNSVELVAGRRLLSPVQDLLVADADNDGVDDILAPGRGGVSVVFGNPNRATLAVTELDIGTSFQLLVHDVDRDGLNDIVSTGEDAIVFARGVGGGVFDAPLRYSAGYNVRDIAAVDIDGDGRDDLAALNEFSNDITVILSNEDVAAQFGGAPRGSTYDPVFNLLTSSTDELGRTTLFDVDPVNGDLRSITRPDNTASNFTNTSQGQIETQTDALGRITEFEYNPLGRLIRTTFAKGTPDEGVQQFEYDAAGNQTAFVDENGNRTEFVYDAMNRLEQIIEPDPDRAGGPLTAPVTMFAYDDAGNLIETRDARNNVTTNEYDQRNRLIKTIHADNSVTLFRYDGNGNLLRVTDPLGNTTRNVYDVRDRLIRTVDPDGGVTRFTYDLDDNLTSLTDPVSNVTRFTYDARDRLIRETDPLGAETLFTYDAVDNLVKKTDRNERITEFVYDELDRLDFETWLNSDGSQANAIDYAYDDVSNLLSAVDDFSALAFTYDNRDRVKTVDNAGAPGAPNVVLTYTYDDVGNVTSVEDVIDGEPGALTEYGYDALNRQVQIKQSAAAGATGALPVQDKRVDFTYNPLGQFESIERFSDLAAAQQVVTTSYMYDTLNRLERLAHDSSTETVAFYDYEYDAASRITQITDVDGVTNYAYDDRSQLIGADRDAADPRGDESYTYDANGNRIDSHVHGSGYVTGDGNRLLSDGTFDYEYDDEGNMILRTEIATGDYREFEWDHRNRLVGVKDFASAGILLHEITFAYDAFGRRIVRIVGTDGDGLTGATPEYFAYDREDVLFTFVGVDANEPVTLNLDMRYLHGPAIDHVLGQENESRSTAWLLPDHLGSTRDIVDANAELVDHITYDSFGKPDDAAAAVPPSRYLFTGREYERESLLLYYRNRYYDVSTGRFASEDRLRFVSDEQNLYRYVLNTPLSLVDPFGLEVTFRDATPADSRPTDAAAFSGAREAVQRDLADPSLAEWGFHVQQSPDGYFPTDPYRGDIGRINPQKDPANKRFPRPAAFCHTHPAGSRGPSIEDVIGTTENPKPDLSGQRYNYPYEYLALPNGDVFRWEPGNIQSVVRFPGAAK